MKKIISILLTLILLVSTGAQALAAQTSGAADTLRLEKSEGTVSVTNNSGKAVTTRDGMRLYSGYTVSTAAKSYAYITLDDTKAVKVVQVISDCQQLL